MPEAVSMEETKARLLGWAERLERHEGFAEVVSALLAGHAATLDGVWGSSCALAAAALEPRCPGTLLVVCPWIDQPDDFLDDWALFSARPGDVFPARELLAGDLSVYDEAAAERLALLRRFSAGEPPRLLAASIHALLQPVVSPELLAAHTRRLAVGQSIDADEFCRFLAQRGFQSTTAVQLPGEFARRGGIIDLFPTDGSDPLRIELFGDEIESLRPFDVNTQRSQAALPSVSLTAIDPQAALSGTLTDYLPPSSWVLLIEPSEIEVQARQMLERLEDPKACYDLPEVMSRLLRFPSITASGVAAASMEATCRLKIESVERFGGDLQRVRAELDEAGAGDEVFVVAPTEAEAARLAELFGQTRLAQAGRLHYAVGKLHSGFRLVSEGWTLLSSDELFARGDVRRPTRRRLSRAIDSFMELRPGDLVVHVAHGIARYRGLELIDRNGQTEEHLVLEFDGQAKLYVPSTKIGLVQKYVGGTRSRPALAKLGGRVWERQKSRVEQAVTDLAADMIDIQAARASQPGIAFPPDSPWQREFDASFPYEETPDQLSAIAAIKDDMCRPRPMDRLLCGDVGYGKTEVAMRAAFKAVEAGYQVAVLVPTTVLAEQHLRTFKARMAEFPFEIAALSRFATRAKQTEIIERLARGEIDIVIGTHRLVQPDVKFENLGLVIIDEEQRFGVEVKERLKALRRIVDVLTMTATPIPRTLHMSLLGIRDISNLETPPEERLAVETRVTRFDADLIRRAVLRELYRDGQAFFIHNRVSDLGALADQLRKIVLEARWAVAHGQMPEHELEQVMLDFVGRKIDVLLATTIVESGLDIPSANTMFINEADRYGLADLHQLRGRVGRYKHRAYCYLLVDPRKNLTPTAARRLRAIQEFSDMGAGFAIAMRDLEIRGAGNILGPQQSGHIAAVGYEMYCNLLEHAVRRLKRLPPKEVVDVDVDLPIEAYLPAGYVPDLRQKIDVYRRLARASRIEEVDDLRAEWLDRFGPLPPPAARLLELAGLRIAAHRWQITAIRREDQYLVFHYRSAAKIRRLADMLNGRLRVVDTETAYYPLNNGQQSPEELFETAKSLLPLT